MAIVVFLILLVMCGFSYMIDRKICNLVTFFLGLWTMVVFLSSLSLYGMREVTDKPYFIILVGCVSFGVGYYALRKKRICFGIKRRKTNYDFNYIAIFCVQIICTFFLILMVSRTITYLFSSDGLNVLRNLYQGYSEGSLFANAWEAVFNNLILAPFMFVTVCLLVIMFFEKLVGAHKVVFGLGILDIGLYVMMNAGRVMLAFAVLSVLMMFSVYSIRIRIDKKTKRRMVFLIAIMVAVVYAITALRKSSITEWDSIHQIYSYGAITPSLLDYWSSYVDKQEILTFGMGFFNGVVSVLKIFFGKLGIVIPLKELTEEMIGLTETFLPVFANKNYNAFVSAFFYFYMDFRYIGVISGGLFLGVASSQSYYAVRKRKNYWNLMVYLLILYCIFKTITRWELISPVFVLALAYTRIFVKKKGEQVHD